MFIIFDKTHINSEDGDELYYTDNPPYWRKSWTQNAEK